MSRPTKPAPSSTTGPFLFACLFAALSPSQAQAHLGHVVSRAERYIKLDVEPEALRIVVSLTLGPNEMARIMRDADANDDGEVDSAEAETYMDSWGAGLRAELEVVVDGDTRPTTWGDSYFDPQGPIRGERGSVEMVTRIELAPGSHDIVIRDAMPTEALDRSDIVIRTQPDGRVRNCRYGDQSQQCTVGIVVQASTASEPIGLTVDVAGLKSWQLAVLAAGAGALVLLSVLILWRRRTGSRG